MEVTTRTAIDIDEGLLAAARQITKLPKKRAVVEMRLLEIINARLRAADLAGGAHHAGRRHPVKYRRATLLVMLASCAARPASEYYQ